MFYHRHSCRFESRLHFSMSPSVFPPFARTVVHWCCCCGGTDLACLFLTKAAITRGLSEKVERGCENVNQDKAVRRRKKLLLRRECIRRRRKKRRDTRLLDRELLYTKKDLLKATIAVEFGTILQHIAKFSVSSLYSTSSDR